MIPIDLHRTFVIFNKIYKQFKSIMEYKLFFSLRIQAQKTYRHTS